MRAVIREKNKRISRAKQAEYPDNILRYSLISNQNRQKYYKDQIRKSLDCDYRSFEKQVPSFENSSDINNQKRYLNKQRHVNPVRSKKSISFIRNKIIFLIFLTGILIGLTMLINEKITFGGIQQTYHTECIGFKSVKINKGDTLYSLSKEYGVDGKDHSSYRTTFIQDVIELNNLDENGKIYAGGYLLIPVYN